MQVSVLGYMGKNLVRGRESEKDEDVCVWRLMVKREGGFFGRRL